jgi:dihydrofolate reductase
MKGEKMRKLVYSLTNSLDNFISRTDGSYDWILMDDEIMSEFPKYFASFDTVLMGRKSYDIAYQQSPETSPETSGYMGMKTYVFSRTLKESPHPAVTIISENAGEFVRNLKNESGKDIWLMGGGILAASLLREHLVDEIGVAIQPIILGSGIPLFPALGRQVDLKLLECKTYKNGIVSLTYRVKN